MSFQTVLLHAGFVVTIFPALMLWQKKQINWPEIKFIAPFVWLAAFGALYEAIVSFQLKVNPTVWFKFYILAEFVAINYFYQKLLGRKRRHLFYGLLAVFVILFLSLQILWISGGTNQTDAWLVILEILLVYVGSIIWFRDIFTDKTLESLWDSPAFYFVSGFILYFSGTFFLFIMSDLVSKIEMFKHWNINVVLTLVLSIIVILGIWKDQQKLHRYSG